MWSKVPLARRADTDELQARARGEAWDHFRETQLPGRSQGVLLGE